MLRKVLILLLLACILATAGASLLLLESREGRALVAEVVHQLVEDATGMAVQIDDVEVRPLRSEVEIVGLRVDGKAAPGLAGVQNVVVLTPRDDRGDVIKLSPQDVARNDGETEDRRSSGSRRFHELTSCCRSWLSVSDLRTTHYWTLEKQKERKCLTEFHRIRSGTVLPIYRRNQVKWR